MVTQENSPVSVEQFVRASQCVAAAENSHKQTIQRLQDEREALVKRIVATSPDADAVAKLDAAIETTRKNLKQAAAPHRAELAKIKRDLQDYARDALEPGEQLRIDGLTVQLVQPAVRIVIE